MSNIDDFPEDLLKGPSVPGARKTFSLGSEDDVADDEDIDVNEAVDGFSDSPLFEEEEETHDFDLDPEPEPEPRKRGRADFQQLDPEEVEMLAHNLTNTLESLDLQTIASNIVGDQGAELAKAIIQPAYREKGPQGRHAGGGTMYGVGERVSRAWLETLPQRSFFLALGYPAQELYQRLGKEHTITGIKKMVDGVDRIDAKDRKILMLEHLLERRTHSTRSRLPNKTELLKVLSSVTQYQRISHLLEGFDNDEEYNERYGFNSANSLAREAADQTARNSGLDMRSTVTRKYMPKQRPGANLPIPSRLMGKGRPLGQKLLKPNSNCYKISAASALPGGRRQLTPFEAMQLTNEGAELEARYDVYYMLRRKDMNKPWSMENFEHVPADQMLTERQSHGD